MDIVIGDRKVVVGPSLATRTASPHLRFPHLSVIISVNTTFGMQILQWSRPTNGMQTWFGRPVEPFSRFNYVGVVSKFHAEGFPIPAAGRGAALPAFQRPDLICCWCRQLWGDSEL